MSKRIDKFVFWLATIVLSFIFFSYAWKNTWLAIACTAALAFLLYLTIGQFSNRYLSYGRSKKQFRRYAEKRVRDWVYASGEVALCEAQQAILRAYGIQNALGDASHRIVHEGKQLQFVLLHKHPDGIRADATEIAELWKKYADADVVVAVNTGKYDEKALAISTSLSSPKFIALDAGQLTGLILQTQDKTQTQSETDARTSAEPSTLTTHRARQIPAFLRMTNKKSAPRNALYGVLLMALYFVLGIQTYLIAALFLLALAVIGWRKPSAPNKLI